MLIFGSVLDSGEKITLDQDSFKALASETRIGILKKLDDTQLTVSDLARELKMSKATLFEHLERGSFKLTRNMQTLFIIYTIFRL